MPLSNIAHPGQTPCLRADAIRRSVCLQVDWLVDLGLSAFWTVLQSISGRLPERGRKKGERIDERINVKRLK